MQRQSHIWLKHPSCSGRPKNILQAKAEEIAAGCSGKDKDIYFWTKSFLQKKQFIQNYVVREILERLSGHRNDLTAGHIRRFRSFTKIRPEENQSSLWSGGAELI